MAETANEFSLMAREIAQDYGTAVFMNSPSTPHPAELCLQRAFARVENYVRHEPAKAVAAALSAGLLLKLIPARAIARPLTATAAILLPPTLLGLGIIKALELCLQENSARHAQPPPPL